MNSVKSSVYLKCDCNCAMLVIEKIEFSAGDIGYNISVVDSRYDHNHNSLWGRVKNAFKALFGKSVYYNDIYLDDTEKFSAFIKELTTLMNN